MSSDTREIFIFRGVAYKTEVQFMQHSSSCRGCAFYNDEEGCMESPGECFDLVGVPDGYTKVWVEK